MPSHEELDHDHERHSLPPEQASPSFTSWRNPWVIICCVLVALFLLMGTAAVHLVSARVIPGVERVSWAGGGSRIMGPPGAVKQALIAGGMPGGVEVDGVVTSASGSQLIIAGGGTTTTVDVTSSTQYSGGSSAALNDTVQASGTISNGTFTAARIAVNP